MYIECLIYGLYYFVIRVKLLVCYYSLLGQVPKLKVVRWLEAKYFAEPLEHLVHVAVVQQATKIFQTLNCKIINNCLYVPVDGWHWSACQKSAEVSKPKIV